MQFSKIVTVASILGLVACSSSATRTVPLVTPLQGAAERVGPSPSVVTALKAKPKRVALLGTGSNSTQALVVSEKTYKGTFSETDTCKNIARVAPKRGSGPVLRLNVTGIKFGRCKIAVLDALHHVVNIPVLVTKSGLAFRLVVPKSSAKKLQVDRKIKSRFISPSTQALSVDIAGPSNESLVFGETQLALNCSPTLDGLACAFATGLAPCSDGGNCYTATVTAYDAYDPAYNDIPPGANALAIASQSFSVTSGQSTVVDFAFSGIPAQIELVPDTPFEMQSGNAITLVGPGPHAFLAEPLDADRNPIAGLGAPSFAVSASGALGVTVTQPPKRSPAFTMQPPAAIDVAESSSVTVTAGFESGMPDGCAQPGASCASSFLVTALPLVAGSRNYQTEIAYYALIGLGEFSAPLLTLAYGIDGPNAQVFDSSNTLYVANLGNNTVTVYPLGATTPSQTISNGLSSPVGLELDPSGNLFVMNAVGPITGYKPGSSTPFFTKTVASDMRWFAVDAADDLWVLVSATNVNGQYEPGGSVTFYPADGSAPKSLRGFSAAVGIGLDAWGWLYVADGDVSGCHPNHGPYCAPVWAYAPGTLENPKELLPSQYLPQCALGSYVQGPDGNAYSGANGFNSCEFGHGNFIQTVLGANGAVGAPGVASVCRLAPQFEWVYGACANAPLK